MNSISKKIILSTMAATMAVSCVVDEYGNSRSMTNTEKGAIIGAATGALLGYKKDGKKKAVLYGIVGGLAGGGIGAYMDAQRKDFEKQLANEIKAGDIELKKLPEDNLMVTMTAQTAFDVNATNIKPGFNSTMDKISGVVNKYGKTHLNIIGHTDSQGSNEYNQRLSEQRAASVQTYFTNKGVIPQRLSIYGAGEENPRADNNTAAGRMLNRRVEIIIEPVKAPG